MYIYIIYIYNSTYFGVKWSQSNHLFPAIYRGLHFIHFFYFSGPTDPAGVPTTERIFLTCLAKVVAKNTTTMINNDQ